MKKRIAFDILVILIIGLIPTLWLTGGHVLLGHDAGLAIDPVVHFLDRLHVWSQRFSIGTDQNGALLGAFLIHAFEALPVWLGASLSLSQTIQFVFWFTLPGLSMYFFVAKFFPEKKYMPLIASIIYMLNYYLVQGWFVAERTKFSLYIAFPLVMYFLLSFLTRRISLFKAVMGTGIIVSIFNGGGSFPLYGGMVFAGLITIFYVNIINFNLDTIKRTIYYSIGVIFLYFLLNAYWLIPYAFYVSGFYSRDLAMAGGAEGVLSWAKYLSSQSTFINLFRGQGIPDWYLNPFHSYSQTFLSNPFLIIASFLFPVFAFLSLWYVKVKKDAYIIYLAVLICLVGIVFSSGPQSQFGFIFELLVKYVPGFAMFRSAFYKFDYLVWFTYGILIGYTLDALLSRLEFARFKKYSFAFSTIALVVFAVLYILYHYPVLNGSFLNYSHEPGKELTTRVKVPDYIFEFSKWVNTRDPNERFLVMPQLRDDIPYLSYDWKFWSNATLNSLLSRNSFVHNTQLASAGQRVLMGEMYAAFLRGDMESFRDFTDVFAIDSIVLQKDYDWKNIAWGTINPAKYEVVLQSHPDLFIHLKTIGKWEVYKLAERKQSIRINSSKKLSFLQGKLGKVVSFPYFAPKSPLFVSDIELENNDYYAKNATDIFLAPECTQCDLEYKEGSFKYYNPKILPGSFLYPIVTYRENKVKASSHDFASLLTYYIATSNRRIIEVKWMADSRNRIDKILETLERYRQTLHEFRLFVSQREWSSSAKEENKEAQMIMNHIISQVNLIDEVYRSEVISYYHRLSIAESYNEILEIDKLVNKKAWVTEDMTNKKYIYDLPVTGDYEIYVKKGSLTNSGSDASSTTVTFRDSNTVLKPVGTVGDWLDFGNVTLPEKKTFIALKDGSLVNLLDKIPASFPDGKQGITQTKNNFSLSVDGLNKCFYYQFHDLEFLNTQYVVTFKYRNFSDNNTLSFFNQAEGDELLRYSIKDFSLASFRYWKTYTKLITPKDGNVRLYFCNGFLSLGEMSTLKNQSELDLLPEGQILVEIQDITFHKVAYPNIVLYKKQKDVADKNEVISFTKKDPVNYTVNLDRSDIDEPFSLIMRESYGKYWKVCDENKKCLSFDDKAHFSTGGFANAWFLKDQKLGNKLTIYYYPQRWYIIGIIITLTSFGIIIIGALCIRILRKK